MKTWIRPMIIEECFVSNENIASSVTACYRIACNVGGPPYEGALDYSNGPGWNNHPEYGGVWHESSGTGNCSDPNSNRVLTDGMASGSSIQEYRADRKENDRWLYGQIENIIPNQDNIVGPGATVYWYTKDDKRRWNHYGVIQPADASHPNHS